MQLLHSAHERKQLDADVLSIIEGALAASEIRVSDVMVPRVHMEVIDIIAQINRTAHSRFPVVDGKLDNVISILLAKDLLRVQTDWQFDLRDWVRQAVFIPESKRLDVLLREFRVSHNHMAVVIDEYAGVSGLITIEDVLEQIVGESEDNIRRDRNGCYVVKAQTEIDDFNAILGADFRNDECHTVGGLALNHLGRVPRRMETVSFGGLRFQVLRADNRRLYTLIVTPELAANIPLRMRARRFDTEAPLSRRALPRKNGSRAMQSSVSRPQAQPARNLKREPS